MANRPPATRPAHRIVQYVDPGMLPGRLAPMTERQLLAKQAQDRVLYARWVQRQAVIAERDRKVRRFWLGFGLVLGLAVLAAIGGAIWFVVHAAASIGIGLLAIPLVVLALAGLAVGGQRCVTTIQHWH